MDDWLVMSRCNRVVKQLFGKNYRVSNSFARLAYQRWTIEGITPEELRDRRAPSLSALARLRESKQPVAGGFHPGAS